MSGQPKGVANVKRRTWDADDYARKAVEREQAAEGTDQRIQKPLLVDDDKEEFRPAPSGAVGPTGSQRAFLKAREGRLNLDSSLGTTKVVTGTQGEAAGGFWCKVCECLLKDSASYADHVNGKKHMHKLGFSMRVEKVSVDQVRERLAAHKRKQAGGNAGPANAAEEYQKRLQRRQEEEEMKKKQKSSDKRRRKEDSRKPLEDEYHEPLDPGIIAAMGIAGFGGSRRG